MPSAPSNPEYAAGAPIPNAPGVPTGKSFVPIYEAWEKRVFVETYRRFPVRDPEVEAFLADAAMCFHRGNPQERAALSSRGQALQAMGKGDPAVQLLCAVAERNVLLRENYFQRAAAGFEKSVYAPFLRFIALANYAYCLAERKADAAAVAAADGRALEALKIAFNTESFAGDDSVILRWRLSTGVTESLFARQGARIAAVFREATNLPEWIRAYGEGRGYVAEAWKLRGDGLSSTVTDAGALGFQTYLGKARASFTKSWKLNPRDPGAAGAMIYVATGDHGGKANIRLWFDRAVAAQMDFYDAYHLFLWALRPRWHGSHEEMLLLGDEFLRTGRFDTCVPFHYFKVVADIASEESDPSAIYGRPEIAANLKLVVDNYLANPDSPLEVSFAQTAAAILDFKAGNLAAAKSHMAAIKNTPDSNISPGLKNDLTKLMQSIAVSAGPGTVTLAR